MAAVQPEPWLRALITTNNKTNDQTEGQKAPFPYTNPLDKQYK
jgi:hypothetical protein